MVLRSPKIRVLSYVDEHGKAAPGEALYISSVPSGRLWHCTVCKVLFIYRTSLSADRAGSVRMEQVKLVASRMSTFVNAMHSVLQQRAWESLATKSKSASSPAAAAAQSSASRDAQFADTHLVSQLVAMGFSQGRASQAALETGNTGTCCHV